jgi:group I intron endonuclease
MDEDEVTILELEDLCAYPRHGDGKIPGAYLVVDKITKQFYVGSTQDLSNRKDRHRTMLNAGKHHNCNLQEAFDNGHAMEFVAIPTLTKDAAVWHEQNLLDTYQGTGHLFNKAISATKNFEGLKHSEEDKIKMVRNRTIFAHTEETKQQISQTLAGRITSPRGLAVMLASNERRSLSVSIDGIQYASLSAAQRAINVNSTDISKRIRTNDPRFPNWFFVNNDPEPPEALPRVVEKDLEKVD